MIYLKEFQTDTDRKSYSSDTKYVSYTEDIDKVHILDHEVYDYLTFIAKSDGNFYFHGKTGNTIEYSMDGGKTWSGGTSAVTVNVQEGDIVKWRGQMKPQLLPTDYTGDNALTYAYLAGIGTFAPTNAQEAANNPASFEVRGNSMSLLYKDNFSGHTTLENNTEYSYCFASLFYFNNETKDPSYNANIELYSASAPVVEALRMYLPTLSSATETSAVTKCCFNQMFFGCKDLIHPPFLFSTKLSQGCYFKMFQECKSLNNTMSLPATTLTDNCYQYMFAQCEKIKVAPKLDATALTISCYESMFQGCTSLTSPTPLPATKLGKSCYESMFRGCTSLKAAFDLTSEEEVPTSGYSHMFSGCTSLVIAPKITVKIATSTGSGREFRGMFANCTSLQDGAVFEFKSTIPNGRSQMFSDLYNGCSALTSVTFLTYNSSGFSDTNIQANDGSYEWFSSGVTNTSDCTFYTIDGKRPKWLSSTNPNVDRSHVLTYVSEWTFKRYQQT